MKDALRTFGSFRDPSGTVFTRDGVLYRQINECYRAQYERLNASGLYARLTKAELLVSHRESDGAPLTAEAFLVIEPERVPMISYPYEWSFSMLRDAALVTLRAHRAALDAGMILKDASAYNVQFLRGRPVLIDTLSFDLYRDGVPWVAYGQFCRHFLAPLLLMAYKDIRLNRLMSLYIDGIPLDLATKLLGGKGGFFARQHIVWHAKSIADHDEDGKRKAERKQAKLPLSMHVALIDSLIRGVSAIKPPLAQTEWGDYYAHTNYSGTAFASKTALIEAYLEQVAPRTVWDIGANDGRFSRLGLKHGASVVALDIDPKAVESGYLWARREKAPLLPLLCDLTNPSPAIGFALRERDALASRGKPDCILALAVIHHLAISNNLPLPMIAEWLSSLCERLIIEFVPKEDSQTRLLLSTRDDIFPNYTKEGFEEAFSAFFDIERAEAVTDSCRTMYLMRSKR